jgi:hypothetical protein
MSGLHQEFVGKQIFFFAFCRHTYEAAPFFMATERAVLKKFAKLLGLPDEVGDGIFCPGMHLRLIYC